MTPPSHKQAGRFFFFNLLKHVHLHFKYVKEMASVSAAVTAFGRQAGDVCLCDTDKIYHATDTTKHHACVTRYCSTKGCQGKPETVCVNF